MKRYVKKTTTFILTASCIIFALSAGAQAAKKTGEAVVKVRGNSDIQAIAQSVQAEVADSILSRHTYLLKFSNDRSVEDVVQDLNEIATVELASENMTIGLPEVFQISQGFPDESVPIFNEGVSPLKYYNQEGKYNIAIDSAHYYATGHDIVVAVIDNGLDFTHPLIQNSDILNGHDFVLNRPVPSEELGDILGHGTFVTGLLLLTAPDISVLPLRAFDGDGVGDQFNVAKAIDWAVRQKVDIINMSFGAEYMIDVLQDAIDDAIDKNIVLVSASGNDGLSSISYPAADPNVISVGAVDTLEMHAAFANYGSSLDIVAPGVNLYSSLAGEYEWGTWSGTSFSTPIVTGTIAMMKEIDNTFTLDEIKNHIRNTARTDLLWGTVTAPDSLYGYGMINSYRAVKQLLLGDLNLSGERDISDLTLMIDYITNRDSNNMNSANYQERTGFLITDELVDINCDGKANMSDVSLLVHHIFVNWRDFKPCHMRGNTK